MCLLGIWGISQEDMEKYLNELTITHYRQVNSTSLSLMKAAVIKRLLY